MASIHAEVPQDISIVKIHEIIDRAEKELSNELNIILVIHMDPINTNDKEVNFARKELEKIIKNYSVIKSIHDFRIVGEGEKKNLIFDIVIDYNQSLTEEFQTKIVEDLSKDIKKIHPLYDAVITIDRDFT